MIELFQNQFYSYNMREIPRFALKYKSFSTFTIGGDKFSPDLKLKLKTTSLCYSVGCFPVICGSKKPYLTWQNRQFVIFQ